MIDENSKNISSEESSPSSYFLTGDENIKSSLYETRVKPFLRVVQYALIQIWPAVNRTLNTIVEFSIRLIKGIITMAIEQIKNFKGS